VTSDPLAYDVAVDSIATIALDWLEEPTPELRRELTDADFAALGELVEDMTPRLHVGHFSWQQFEQLRTMLADDNPGAAEAIQAATFGDVRERMRAILDRRLAGISAEQRRRQEQAARRAQDEAARRRRRLRS
jgi:hypothetical protein